MHSSSVWHKIIGEFEAGQRLINLDFIKLVDDDEAGGGGMIELVAGDRRCDWSIIFCSAHFDGSLDTKPAKASATDSDVCCPYNI